jgi:DNA-binding MarR family transcriptional regulator
VPDDIPLGVLMFIAYRAMDDRAFAAVAEAGHHDITRAQAKLLQRVNDDGSRLSELADAAQVTKQTAGYLVDQLESAGYVERVPDPTDARARLVRMTGRARELLPIGGRAVAEVEAEWTAHLGRRRMEQLRDILTRLREITDPFLER